MRQCVYRSLILRLTYIYLVKYIGMYIHLCIYGWLMHSNNCQDCFDVNVIFQLWFLSLPHIAIDHIYVVSLWCTSLFPTFISWLTEDSGKSTAKKDMWRPCGRLLLTLSSNLLLQKFSVYLKSPVCVLKLLEWMFWSIKRIKTAYLNSLKLHSFP